MNRQIKWMAGNHVAANLLMMLFVVGGLILGYTVKQEVFPEVQLDRIQTSVAYPGASPEEIEEGIILKIEEAVSSVDGIKEVNSVALEGTGSVTAVLDTGENADRILQDIKSEIDRITTFPEEAEEPVTAKVLNRREVISLVVYGDAPERGLREWAERIRDDLLSLDEITQAELGGVRPYEISIEISEVNLQRFSLTLDEVSRAVHRASLDMPGGQIRTESGEILIRTKERRYTGPEYGAIIVLVKPDGTVVRLGDIATIRDTFTETDTFANFNGMPAAMVQVYRVGNQKPTVIADIVTRYVREKQGSLPDSIKLATWNDTSELFASRLKLLIKNAALGLILVFLILSLFLQMRLALWVMLGIPISFLGALFIMPAMDVSINMISLFAFIMALGIVVDDAIVIGENIYEHRQRGKPYLQAAVDGTQEVGAPVLFSILTTIAAFVPLIFVTGSLGKFIKVIPLVVICILAVSLIESLFVLPAHLGFGDSDKDKTRSQQPGRIEQIRLSIIRGLEWFVSGPYCRLLNFCTSRRYATIATAIAVLLVTVGLVKGGIVKFRFMPEVDSDVITVELRMPRGTPVEETARIKDRIVAIGRDVVNEFDGQSAGNSVLRHIYAVVGGTLAAGGPMGGSSTSGAHLCDIAMLLTPSENRTVSSSEISSQWRKKVGEIAGIESLNFKSNLIRLGANIDVQLAHDDITTLSKAVTRLKDTLASYPGVTDIADNYPLGKRELKIRLTPAARTLGITEEDLGRQVRSAFYGAEALRLQRGRNELKVMVRYPEEQRRNLADFEAMFIRTPTGGEIPLLMAAEIDEGRGYSEINRSNRKRTINVTASVDERRANVEEILQELQSTSLSDFLADYPGLTYSLEGEEKERRDSMGSMMRGFSLALFAMYALLAIPFRSYAQPLLIMAAIPFGMVGAILGHWILGFNLSMLSIFGIVALSGVVVNDSLLLISHVNQQREFGLDAIRAVEASGLRRFRPILLTSLTTFFGLMPMITETSVQAQFLIPMAISLGFGIMFATGITLLLIPSLYLVLEDLHILIKGGKTNG